MPLPAPQLLVAHAILQVPEPLPRNPELDERFIAAVRPEFPNVLARQYLPPEAPPQVPHLTLASSSSQLAVSTVQADFEVRFYGKFLDDLAQGLEYVERKVLAILRGYEAIGATPSSIGLVGNAHFSMSGAAEDPLEHVLNTHVRPTLPKDDVQDALLKVGLKVRDTYFVSMSVTNYESRVFERPVMPGMQMITIRTWDGRVDDIGVELNIDVNNNLEGRVRRADPEVTESGVRAVVRLFSDVVTTTGPRFVETGQVSVADLTASSNV